MLPLLKKLLLVRLPLILQLLEIEQLMLQLKLPLILQLI